MYVSTEVLIVSISVTTLGFVLVLEVISVLSVRTVVVRVEKTVS